MCRYQPSQPPHLILVQSHLPLGLLETLLDGPPGPSGSSPVPPRHVPAGPSAYEVSQLRRRRAMLRQGQQPVALARLARPGAYFHDGPIVDPWSTSWPASPAGASGPTQLVNLRRQPSQPSTWPPGGWSVQTHSFSLLLMRQHVVESSLAPAICWVQPCCGSVAIDLIKSQQPSRRGLQIPAPRFSISWASCGSGPTPRHSSGTFSLPDCRSQSLPPTPGATTDSRSSRVLPLALA